MDTIFAVATASGRAGVSVIRISGPNPVAKLIPFVKGLDGEKRAPQLLALRGVDGEMVDRPLILVFEEGRSFTGEETVEFHLHGSPAIVRSAMGLLDGIDGFRVAQAGEFTRRALINNRMTLEEVEGLGDLIDAETEVQLNQARKLLDGKLREKTEKWREDLVHAAALVQATIDFADEDVPVDVSPEVTSLVSNVISDLNKEIKGLPVSERIRNGFEIAILGAPNAGKSTLLNYLSNRDVAIVSDIAGTTRDVLEVRMDLFGYPVSFLDTAGLRESEDVVENLGMERALKRAKAADLRIWLRSDQEDDFEIDLENDDIVVTGKDDAGESKNGISGQTGRGIEEMLGEIRTVLDRRAATIGVATMERHGVVLREALGFLESAIQGIDIGTQEEIIAEEIRLATHSLDALIGRVDVENVLDKVFSSFCLGK